MFKKNENISYLNKCKICGNNNLQKVIKLNEQYISATFVKSNKDNDLKKIKTNLEKNSSSQLKVLDFHIFKKKIF